MAQWKFRPYGKDEIRSNPIQEEFFTTNEVGSISNAIVREGIQNALDEWTKEPGTIVKIRIFLSGEKYKILKPDFDPLFLDLYPHILEQNSGLRDLPEFKDGMKYLVFEDFNTNGLEGDPEEADADDKSVPHNFFWFWRNIGISGKTDEKLGRWGLGKTVFPASSRINTFWGITVRKNERDKKLLLGQSILISHKVNNEPKLGFVPYGFFGLYKDPSSCFASPIEDFSFIDSFEKKFKLKRNNTSGLSVVVPFVTEEITHEKLIYSAIEQYFLPIIQGKLEISVASEDNEVHLSKDSIRNIIQTIDFSKLGEERLRIPNKESSDKLFNLAEWICSLPELSYIKLKEPPVSNVPQWRNSLFENIDTKNLSEKFENGDRLAFMIPLKYHPKKENGAIKWFKAFLEKDVSLNKAENHYIRNGITITGVNSLSTPGVRGIVLIEDEFLVKMIGDAENPAHTEIQKDSRNFKDKYHNGDKCLSFLTRALHEIFLKLQKPAEGIEKDMLKDIFFVPLTNNENEKVLPDDDSSSEVNEDNVPLINKETKQKIQIIKVENGFRIIKNEKGGDCVGALIEIKMGYMIARGNPITKYDKLDFEMNKPPVKITYHGINITAQQLNELSFEIEEENFEIDLIGFDKNRDLIIKAKELKN